MKDDATKNFAQAMLMVDGPKDRLRGVLLLLVRGDLKEWRWYDAELFDCLDHVKRFLSSYLREQYSIDNFMILLCTVDASGTVRTADPALN